MSILYICRKAIDSGGKKSYNILKGHRTKRELILTDLRKMAYNVIDQLSEEKLRAFLTLFADYNAPAASRPDPIDNSSKYLEKFDKVVDNFNMDE